MQLIANKILISYPMENGLTSTVSAIIYKTYRGLENDFLNNINKKKTIIIFSIASEDSSQPIQHNL